MTINWILPTSMASPLSIDSSAAIANSYSPIRASLFTTIPSAGLVPHPALAIINKLQNNSQVSSSWNPISWINNTWSSVKSGVSNTTTSTARCLSNLGNDIVSCARKYLGYKESDNSYKLFTNGRTEAWCADFVTHVVKESSQKTGKQLPTGFGSSSVEGLRQWGKNNNCYLETASASNKESLIKNNVKPGDIIIFKENGRSHTGIFKGFDSNGRILTIEGNTSADNVAERSYAMNNNTISGFVQVA